MFSFIFASLKLTVELGYIFHAEQFALCHFLVLFKQLAAIKQEQVNVLLWFLFVVQNNRHRKRARRQEGHTLCQEVLSFISDFGVCQIVLSDHPLLDVQIKLCESISNNVFCFLFSKCYMSKHRKKSIPNAWDVADTTSFKLP